MEPAAFSQLTALTQLYGHARCTLPTQSGHTTGHTGAHVVQALICRFPSALSTTRRCAPCMSTAFVLTHTHSCALPLLLCSCSLMLCGNSTVGMDVIAVATSACLTSFGRYRCGQVANPASGTCSSTCPGITIHSCIAHSWRPNSHHALPASCITKCGRNSICNGFLSQPAVMTCTCLPSYRSPIGDGTNCTRL